MIIQARDVCIYFSLIKKGEFKDIYEGIKNHEKFEEETYKKELNKTKSNIVTLFDSDYPEIYKQIDKPPLALYYYGNINLLKSKKILAVVGTRYPDNYGIQSLKGILEPFVKDENVTLISGLAKGIDGVASRIFMENNKPVISVLGSGIDCCYPEINNDVYSYCKSKNGLVISEYPNSTAPFAHHFPFRNRLIAAISDIILIGEAKYKSGSQSTLTYGLNFGKTICTIPASIFNSYKLNNNLLAQGANVITCADDLKMLFDKD